MGGGGAVVVVVVIVVAVVIVVVSFKKIEKIYISDCEPNWELNFICMPVTAACLVDI